TGGLLGPGCPGALADPEALADPAVLAAQLVLEVRPARRRRGCCYRRRPYLPGGDSRELSAWKDDLQCGIAREKTTVVGLGLGGPRTVVVVEPGIRLEVVNVRDPYSLESASPRYRYQGCSAG